MNSDLKLIKKYYGEDMMHFARDNFASILEIEGMLSRLFLDNFAKSKTLYEDLKESGELIIFKSFNLARFNKNKKIKEKSFGKNPSELLSEAGYNLYECKTEEDIQSFKKYYYKDEELCTFSGDRLDRCYVFFAVKRDVDDIKRENFKNPKREDEYGTSVISIQFTKDELHTLSIKNRYNHTVSNPDATFKNNLDNIIPGLTASFEEYYGIKQKYINEESFSEFVRANDGKYYKYNYEIMGNYFCPNNIVIEYNNVVKYDKEKYVVMDCYILDIQNKQIIVNRFADDGFLNTIKDVKSIRIRKNGNNRLIYIKTFMEDEDIIIEVNNRGQIIGYINNNVTEIENRFMMKNKTLEYLEMNNVVSVKDDFLINGVSLKKLSMNRLESIGKKFMGFINKTSLEKVSLPNVRKIGDSFISACKEGIKELYLPNVENIGDKFLLCLEDDVKEIDFPNLVNVGEMFMFNVGNVNTVNLPKINCLNERFLYHNSANILYFNIHDCKTIKNNVLTLGNIYFENADFSSLEKIGDSFLEFSKIDSKYLNMPIVEEIGNTFLVFNPNLKYINMPKVKKIGEEFLHTNNDILEFHMENLEYLGKLSFLAFATRNICNYEKLDNGQLVLKLKKIFRRKNLVAKLERTKNEIIHNISNKDKILKMKRE